MELQPQITADFSSQPGCLERPCSNMGFDGLTEAFHRDLPCNEPSPSLTSLVHVSEAHEAQILTLVCGAIIRLTVLRRTRSSLDP